MRPCASDRVSGWVVTAILIVALATAGATVGQAAAQSTPEATGPIQIVSPAPDEDVVGRDVSIGWEAPGLTIVAAADAKTETDLHAHFIVDGVYEVVDGTPIPQQCGVVHTAANPATLTNLPPGEHTVQLVIANPGHLPVPGLERPSVTFTVADDPEAIRITAPENCAHVAGPDVEIAWEAPGLTIVPAAEAQEETDYHAHFIVDGAYAVVEGAPIPAEDGILHTAANPVLVEGLAPGPHTIQLVIANPGHIPIADLARPTVTVVVGGEGTPVASTGEQTVQVSLTDMAIASSLTTFTVGVPYTFVVTNNGQVEHEMVIEPRGAVDEPMEVNGQESEADEIEPGQTKSVTWTFTAPGEYQLGCHVPAHYEAGMVIPIEVTT